jgi:U3 small nucleolar ribonucleoprotein protein IMP3
MRKLKFHEQKLLKKVNFYDWKAESDKRESKVMHRYHLQDRQDYTHYNKICGLVTGLICKIKQLPFDDPFRIKATEQLLEKLFNMGVINSRENVEVAEKLSVSAFCRRRLAVLLCSLKFAETMKEAVTFIEQGHVRVGTEVVTAPAFLVTRQL